MAALSDDVLDQVLLSIVGGDDTDLFGRVSKKTHVLIRGDDVFCLSTILVEKRFWTYFSDILEILDIYHLKRMSKADVSF